MNTSSSAFGLVTEFKPTKEHFDARTNHRFQATRWIASTESSRARFFRYHKPHQCKYLNNIVEQDLDLSNDEFANAGVQIVLVGMRYFSRN
ncbi:MAG: hypothetical protein ACJAYG_000926 [Oceanicoccus sp.]